MIRLGCRGFTLVELIMFIVVGGIFLPASMLAFTSVMSRFATPDYQVTARFLAEQKIEELTKDAYDSVSTVTQSYTAIAGYTNYQWKWSVCNTGSSQVNLACSVSHTTTLSDYAYYKRIEVSVTTPANDIFDAATIIGKRPRS